MVRGLSLLFRLVVVLFPLVAGSFLFSLGADKLNQAYYQREQWIAPNGLLAFSSMQAQVSWAHLGMYAMSAKNGLTETFLDYDLRLQSGFALGEQVGGFQIPYTISSLNFTVTVSSGHGDSEALAILDQRTISVEEPAKATIVYGKFQVPANAATCHMFLNFRWEGLFVREGFSSYALTVPFANNNETVHSKIFECCSNAVALFDNVPFMVEIGIPYDSELKGSFPVPDTQEITRALVRQYFETKKGWKLSRQSLEIGRRDNGTLLRHEFDLVSENETIVGECKCYKWTQGDFYPSGKISTANEALFYLSRVNAKEKFLVLKEDLSLCGESLPEVYVRRSNGLMDDVEVYKHVCGSDFEKDELIKIRQKGKVWYHRLVAEDFLNFSLKYLSVGRMTEIDHEIQARLQRYIAAFKK
jgi:hypothetical protein